MTASPGSAPLFPKRLSLLFAMVPVPVHGRAVVAFLNRVLSGALREGELDFLQDRAVCIHVEDMQLRFCITLQHGRLVPCQTAHTPDLTITGTLHTFLLLAARREDTDTLFFQRRLRMEGDTELGLEIKNFLDGQDLDAFWAHGQVRKLAEKALPLYERVFS